MNITAGVGVKLEKGNVHIDVVNGAKTKTSGWVPAYVASTDISGVAAAQLNPTAKLTVELECRLFGGLVDLTSGPFFPDSYLQRSSMLQRFLLTCMNRNHR